MAFFRTARKEEKHRRDGEPGATVPYAPLSPPLNDGLRRSLNPTLPQIENTVGDPLEFITVHFPLTALDDLPSPWKESDGFWNWIEAKAPPRKAAKRRSTAAQTFGATMDDGAIVLGTIELGTKTVTLSVNSEARAARGRAMLDGCLRLHVAVAKTRRWRRAAVTGSRRGVRHCGKARHLGQRMANALPGFAGGWLLFASSQIAFADESGTVTGAVGGAVAGAVVGGPVGAVVGGVGGAVIGNSVTNHRHYHRGYAYHPYHHHYDQY